MRICMGQFDVVSECGSLVVDLLHPCYAHFVIGYFLTPAHLGIHDVWLLLSSLATHPLRAGSDL